MKCYVHNSVGHAISISSSQKKFPREKSRKQNEFKLGAKNIIIPKFKIKGSPSNKIRSQTYGQFGSTQIGWFSIQIRLTWLDLSLTLLIHAFIGFFFFFKTQKLLLLNGKLLNWVQSSLILMGSSFDNPDLVVR